MATRRTDLLRLSALAALALAALGLAALTGVLPAPAAAQAGHAAVNCLDENHGTVHETLAGDCRGRIVSDEEAAPFRQDRRDYIRKALSNSPFPEMAGKRLVGLGSGFFIAEDGSVATSHHVVGDCAAVSVTPTFGEMRLATTVIVDPESDLAVLRTDIVPPKVPRLTAAGAQISPGPAYVVGYPSRGLVTIEPVVAAVEVLGRDQNTSKGPAIIVRGDVRRGNSGGPLLDANGSVLGVVVAKIDSVSVYQTSGKVVRDIGLALPADRLAAFLAQHGVDYQMAGERTSQQNGRILEEARPFLVQIGCWQ